MLKAECFQQKNAASNFSNNFIFAVLSEKSSDSSKYYIIIGIEYLEEIGFYSLANSYILILLLVVYSFSLF